MALQKWVLENSNTGEQHVRSWGEMTDIMGESFMEVLNKYGSHQNQWGTFTLMVELRDVRSEIKRICAEEV